MNVEWKEIPGYGQKYAVSTDGRVMNTKTGRILKQGTYGNNQYKNVCLSHESMLKTYPIHRLVALAFIPNPEGKTCVDHIDRNPSNNNVTNLRWATILENNQNRAPRDLPLHVSRHLDGYQVKFKRNGQLYYSYCKTVEDAIAWKEATLNTLNTNLNAV